MGMLSSKPYGCVFPDAPSDQVLYFFEQYFFQLVVADRKLPHPANSKIALDWIHGYQDQRFGGNCRVHCLTMQLFYRRLPIRV